MSLGVIYLVPRPCRLTGSRFRTFFRNYFRDFSRTFPGLRLITGASQPKAGTGHKMLFVPFVFVHSFLSSRFQGPAFRCDKIVVIVTLLEAIEGIPDKDYNFWRNDNFHNLYERLLHERKLKSGYLERRIYERPLHLRVNLLSRIKANIVQNYLYINLL